MSHNLEAEEIELWQTPTWITDICLSYNHKTKSYDGGWWGILTRYTIWVESHTQGDWKSKEQLDSMKESIERHLKELYDEVDKHGRLTFSRN